MKFTLAAVSLASLLLRAEAAPLTPRHCAPGKHHNHHSSSAISNIVLPTASASSAVLSSSASTSTSVAVPAPTSTSDDAPAPTSTTQATPVPTSSTVAPTISTTAQPTTISTTAQPTTTVKPTTTSTTAKPATSSTTAKPSTTSSAAPAPTSGSSYSGSKKGLAFNAVAAMSPFAGSAGWGYNWDSTYQGTVPSGIEFVPMLWSTATDHSTQWATNAKKAIANGATALLAFNEPDLGSQANMSPSDAATGWKKYMEPFHGQATLVSPAITNGPAPAMGTGWMDSFITDCSGCNIDAIAIHIYDSATNVDYYKNYITGIYTKYKKPVWVTEFGASGSTADQQTFLNTMVPWLESQTFIARYAYFADISGYMVDSNNKISPVGSTYASAA